MLNGFKELGIFVYALHNKDDARAWLLENKHPHLMATINAAEGNKQALAWLYRYGYDVLAKVAMAGDGDEEAFRGLVEEGHREMALIAKNIHQVKESIERDNNDIHKISKD